MPNWFPRRRKAVSSWTPANRVPDPQGPLDWIAIPYRYTEAARVSLYTIAFHPELPDNIRQWILDWLGQYNAACAGYFYQNYGPEVFSLLAQISAEVTQVTEQVGVQQHVQSHDEFFAQWENQMKDNNGERP